MPQATTGTPSARHGPTSSRSAPSNSSCASVAIPRSDRASASTAPPSAIAQARQAVVPQSTAIHSTPNAGSGATLPLTGVFLR